MSTPTDPYNTPARRGADEEDLLAPLAPTPSAASAMEAEDFLEDISEDAAPTAGTDPAFDQKNYFTFTREIPATHLGENAEDHREVGQDVSVASETSEAKAAVSEVEATAAQSDESGEATQEADEPRVRRSIFAQTASEDEEPSPYLPTAEANAPKRADVTAGSSTGVGAGAAEPAVEAASKEAGGVDSPAANESNAAEPAAEEAANAEPATRTARHRHKKEDAAPAPAFELEDDPFAALVSAPIEPVEIPEHHRGWAHVGVFFLSLVLIPSAWYVFADAAAKIADGEASQWATGVLNTPAMLEMLGAAAIGLLIALSVRASSLGAWIWGLAVTSLGATALVSPYTVKEYILKPLENAIGDYNAFTANLVDYLRADLSTGRIFIYGIGLLLISFVAHSVRRRAMKEGELRGRALESQERSGAAKAATKGK